MSEARTPEPRRMLPPNAATSDGMTGIDSSAAKQARWTGDMPDQTSGGPTR